MQKLVTLMCIQDNFFSKRRSVMAKKMSSDPINNNDLDYILQAGIRVPDHGALNPWKLNVIQGAALRKIDEEIILTEFIKKNPDSEKNAQDSSSSESVMLEYISRANLSDEDVFILVQATSPFTKTLHFDEAIEKFRKENFFEDW